MSRIMFISIVAIVVGILGGVLEVSVHPEKLSSLPGTLSKIVQDGSLYEKGRHYATSLKRAGEFIAIKDEKQRLELAVGYVKADAERLNELLGKDQSAEQLMPQAELLTVSLERAGDLTTKAHVDNIAALGQQTKEAFALAAESVKRLRETHETYRALEEKLAGIVSTLEKHIGTVAGTKDENPPANEPTPTIPAIQLNF